MLDDYDDTDADTYTADEVAEEVTLAVLKAREAFATQAAELREWRARVEGALAVAAAVGAPADVVRKAVESAPAVVAKAPDPVFVPDDDGDDDTDTDTWTDPDFVALAYTGVCKALDAHQTGDDPQPDLDALYGIGEDPEAMAELIGLDITKALQFKAYREDDHPRDDKGRFVKKTDIAQAQHDPAKAEELRAKVTDPKQRAKLDAAIGDKEGRFITKKEHARRLSGAKKDAKTASREEARRLAHKIRDDHNSQRPVGAADLHALIPHLSTMTHTELSNLRTHLSRLGASFGGARTLEERAKRLREFIHGAAGAAGKRATDEPAADSQPVVAPEAAADPAGAAPGGDAGGRGGAAGVAGESPAGASDLPDWSDYEKLKAHIDALPKTIDRAQYQKLWDRAGETSAGAGDMTGEQIVEQQNRLLEKLPVEQRTKQDQEDLALAWGAKNRKIKGQSAKDYKKNEAEIEKRYGTATHRAAVESALAAGKPVPPEVLADYPDLAAKGSASKPAKPARPWGGTGRADDAAPTDDEFAAASAPYVPPKPTKKAKKTA